ncbi:MAG: nucleotide exchange factor GrpE [Rhizobiales bacterium]|nr:nucleotide exchange factor GrpE [Hyphomicrobiales bacterium]
MSAEDKPQTENASESTAKPDVSDRLAGLERENADLKDRLLRALAEMENLRRRTEREIQDTRAFSITKFASDMIGTADNLRRAIESAPKAEQNEEGEAIAKAVQPLLEGVSLTERELLKALEKHGVKRREPVGERFDPHRDQAMFEIPDETVPNGTVMQVVQVGYTIGERILRPAMVGVSKGGPARPTSESEGAGAEAKPESPRSPAADSANRPKFDKRA